MGGFSTRFGSPSLPVVTLDHNSNAYPAGHHYGDVLGLTDVEPNLIPDNILYGVEVFGVTGNATHWTYNLISPILFTPVPMTTVTSVVKLVTPAVINQAESLPVPLCSLTDATASSPLPVDGFVAHVQVPLADTDETAAANSGAPDDMDLLPVSLSGNGDGSYFGLATKFDWVVVKVSTAGTGSYHIVWKYWNGTQFVTLTTFNDNTNNFQTAGTVRAQFARPADWAATIIAGITAYWIKAEVDSGSMSIQPKGQQALIGQY
jgi:hypothetical protein